MKQWKGKLNDQECIVKFGEEYDYWVNIDIQRLKGVDSVIAVVDENSIWFTSMGVFYTGSYEKVDDKDTISGYSYFKDEKKVWKLIFEDII